MDITPPSVGTRGAHSPTMHEEVGDADQVVIDTSVLVADPESLFSFGDADVVIPLTVLEELDGLKTRPDEVGRAARSVVRSLEELRLAAGGDLAAPVELPDGGTLRIELNGLRVDRLASLHLDPDKDDNRILAAALGLAGEGSKVRLASADGALRIKAAALGLSAEDYERTVTRSRLGGVGSALTLDVTASLLDDLYERHRVGLDDLVEDPQASGLVANHPVVLRCGSQSALGRVVGGDLVQIRTSQSAWGLRPRSKEQHFALDLLLDPEVVVCALTGRAGTGKTLLALAAGLEQVFEPTARAHYDRMMILRPVVAVGRQELGFLPGDLADKLGPWFEAVVDAVVALGEGVSHRQAKDMIEGWMHDGRLDLQAVTYLRGRSLQRTYVLIDEFQNLEPSVAKTVLTRLGEGSKMAALGDTSQIDSPFLSERTNALSVMADALGGQRLFGHVELTRGERSPIADLAADLL